MKHPTLTPPGRGTPSEFADIIPSMEGLGLGASWGSSMIVKLKLLLLFLTSLPAWGAHEASEVAPQKVVMEFFFETGCDSCAEVRRTVFPELEQRYSGYYDLHERDIGIQSNFIALVHYQEVAGGKDNEPVSLVVDGHDYLPGVARIKAQLFPAIEQALRRQFSHTHPLPLQGGDPELVASRGGELVGSQYLLPDPLLGGVGVGVTDVSILQRRIDRFTLLGVISVAAVDSINPCAIAALVLFMSLLSSARIGVSRMWLSGLAFLVACFVTYLGIGFGLLKVLGFLTAFQGLREVMDWLLITVMMGFALLSFRDAVRYHRTGRAADVVLKLPDKLQTRIHRVMKGGLQKRHLILGGLGVGVVVTVLESVCTGQVYVPALVIMLKSGQSIWRCMVYLLVYNAVFVMPLLIVLGLTCAGLKTPVLVAWSRRNVVTSKILLGLLFLGMTALMVLLH